MDLALYQDFLRSLVDYEKQESSGFEDLINLEPKTKPAASDEASPILESLEGDEIYRQKSKLESHKRAATDPGETFTKISLEKIKILLSGLRGHSEQCGLSIIESKFIRKALFYSNMSSPKKKQQLKIL